MFSSYKNLFILSLGVFAVVNTELGIIGILPELALASGKTIPQMGYLISTFALTVTFLGPFFTILVLRVMERKTAFLLAQIFLSITNALFIFYPSYPVLFVARTFGGLGHSLFFTLALSYVTKALPPEKTPLGASIIFGGANVAFIVGFPVISFLTSTFSYKIGIGFSLLLNLFSLLILFLFIPKASLKENSTVSFSLSSFKDKNFLLTVPILTILVSGVFIMYGYFSPYLRQIWSIDSFMLTKSLFYFGIFGLVGNFLLGLVPTSKVTHALFISIFSLLVTYILLASGIHIPIFILVSLWGFLQSVVFLLAQLWFTANKTAPAEAVNSVLVSSANFGITLGSFFGGVLIGNIGISILPWIGICLFLIAVAGISLDILKRRSSPKKILIRPN